MGKNIFGLINSNRHHDGRGVNRQLSTVNRPHAGFSLAEILLSVGLVLLIGAACLMAVIVVRRQSRDDIRLSDVRQAQARLEFYRQQNGSYPAAADAAFASSGLSTPLDYAASPADCGAQALTLCADYVLKFSLEGAVGQLKGGDCAASSRGITCSK